jgi:hypothetical protein
MGHKWRGGASQPGWGRTACPCMFSAPTFSLCFLITPSSHPLLPLARRKEVGPVGLILGRNFLKFFYKFSRFKHGMVENETCLGRSKEKIMQGKI